MDKLSASEALYGFCGWLTSGAKRAQIGDLTMSAWENAAPAADLVKQFCDANQLPDPREGWDKILKHPKD